MRQRGHHATAEIWSRAHRAAADGSGSAVHRPEAAQRRGVGVAGRAGPVAAGDAREARAAGAVDAGFAVVPRGSAKSLVRSGSIEPFAWVQVSDQSPHTNTRIGTASTFARGQRWAVRCWSSPNDTEDEEHGYCGGGHELNEVPAGLAAPPSPPIEGVLKARHCVDRDGQTLTQMPVLNAVHRLLSSCRAWTLQITARGAGSGGARGQGCHHWVARVHSLWTRSYAS